MRATSAVLILAAASAAPAFAAPVSTSYNARRQTTGNDNSGAALTLEDFRAIFSKPFIARTDQLRREAIDILARAEESGAIKLGDAANIASIGSSVISVIHSLFGGSNDQQRRDELIALLARAEQDDSGAISFSTIKDIGSIGGSAISILHNLLGGSSDNQQRDFAGFAKSHGIDNHIFKLPTTVINGPDFGKLVARQDVSGMSQRDLVELPDGHHVINSHILKPLTTLIGGPDFTKLVARQDVSGMSQRDLVELPDGHHVIGSHILKPLTTLIGGPDFTKLVARQDVSGMSQRDLIELPDGHHVINNQIFKPLTTLIGGNGFTQLVARQDVSGMSQSDAIKLGTLGTIFSVGAPLIGGIIDHFKGGDDQQQRREPEELFARQDVSGMSQSDAIKLGTLGTIFSVGAPIIGGIIDHFKGGDSQQQRRELEELLARFSTGSLDALD